MRMIFCAALLTTASFQASAQDGVAVSPEQSMRLPASWTMEVSSCAMSQQGGEAVLSATIVTGTGSGAGPHVKRQVSDAVAGAGPGGGPHVKRQVSDAVTSAGPGGGPHVKRQVSDAVAADNFDRGNSGLYFSWGQTNSSSTWTTSGAGRIVPTVIAHAINTKGAGSVDRVSRQVCAAPPAGQRLLLPAVQKREAKPVATCDASGDPAMPAFTIHMPLSEFGQDAKRGHVSIIKREASAPSMSERGSSIGDMGSTVVATCSANARGGANYDLAIGKKV